MSLLDDLKQQADALLQKQQVTQVVRSQNLLLAHAKLKDALHYWVALFNSLNIIKPVVSRDYYLDGAAAKLENLLQHDYNINARRLTIDHKDYIEAVVLRFRCVADQKFTIEKQSEPMVQRMREQLWAYNLKFDIKEIRNERGYIERGIFTVLPEVPVTITISTDLETAQTKIIAKNLEKFGEYTCIYDYDEFGQDILEELGKIIIAQPNTFRTSGKHQVAIQTSTKRAIRPNTANNLPSHTRPDPHDMSDPDKVSSAT